MKRIVIIFLALGALMWACGTGADDKAQAIKKADSLSISLNSPELKAVNAEILKDPSAAALYDKRARVYLNLREFTEAEYDSKRAIQLDSSQALYYLTLADIHFAANKTRESKELLESTAKKFPENIEALMKLAELYFLVQRYQDGIDYVNRVLRLNENLAKAYYIKGSIYRESGDTSRAISSLETAVEQDNQYTDAFYDLGILYAARKNPVAFQYYDNVLRIQPHNTEVMYARAMLLQNMGKADDALAQYQAILDVDKNCDRCYHNRGAIYLELKKDPRKALEEFTRAIQVNPSYVEAYFARGYTYSRLKDKESAKADYRMCLKIQPNYDPAVEGLNDL
jgi:tetratricopeptide (TPR) repeat protein